VSGHRVLEKMEEDKKITWHSLPTKLPGTLCHVICAIRGVRIGFGADHLLRDRVGGYRQFSSP
jgi:hypothetical protein